MKTNRQKKYHSFQPRHSQPARTNAKVRDTVTMASLAAMYKQQQEYKLQCRHKLIVTINSKEQRNKFNTLEDKGPICYVNPGRVHTMREFFQCHPKQPCKKYIFSAKMYEQKASRSSSIRKSQGQYQKNNILTRTASDTALTCHQGNNRPSKQSPELNLPAQNKSLFKKYLSHKNLDDKERMFAVQQVKESQQSQIKESLKSLKEANGTPSSQLHPNTTQNYLSQLQASHAQKQNLNLPINTMLPLQSFQANIQKPIITSRLSKEPSLKQQQSKFSLTKHLEKGIVQQESAMSHQNSFKIAGDQEIERAKMNIKPDMQNGSIQELSSIISNARQDNKRENSHQFDSLSKDIQDLNQFTQPVKRINLNNIAHQRQQNKDKIQINQHTSSQGQGYTVKYNLTFLKKKNHETQVTRVSPLRFRKKEQMMQRVPLKPSQGSPVLNI